MDSTNQDFWNMVYQEKSCIILMLTNETENNKVKCAKYWPDFGKGNLINYLYFQHP